MSNNFNKIAVDESAKKYWTLLFKEYGEALVRDVPRRIKAALFENKKVASIDQGALLLPVAHAKSGTDLHIEGLYRDGKTKLMFHATLDKDLEVKEVKSFELR